MDPSSTAGEPQSSATAVFNPFRPSRDRDVYAVYRRLRELNPVHVNVTGEIVATRYADCLGLLRDPRLSSNLRTATRWSSFRSTRRAKADDPMETLEALRVVSFLLLDPPEHTRLRSLVNRAFTPRAVAKMRPWISRLVENLLQTALERGSLDVIADLADPLPVSVISELLGIPPGDRADFRQWTREISFLIEYPLVRRLSRTRGEALEALVDLLRRLVARRRETPADDLLSGLVQAEVEGDRLTENEVLGIVYMLLLGGQETTVNLIGSGALALADHPEQARRLREGPTIGVAAVEEMVRFNSPIQLVARVAKEPMDIAGVHADQGQQVVILLGSANRDDTAFVDADRFLADRSDNRHLGFGFGPHFCIGAPLARIETELALSALLHHLPELKVEGEPTWRRSAVLRGLDALVLAVP